MLFRIKIPYVPGYCLGNPDYTALYGWKKIPGLARVGMFSKTGLAPAAGYLSAERFVGQP